MPSTFSKQSITLEAANAVLRAAEAEARRLGLSIAAAVVDDGGHLKAASRMDGAALVATDAAYKKARTAVGFGLETGEAWYDFIKDDPILLHGAPQLQDFILLGGGLPIVIDGHLCGALGVAGGHYAKDAACARAGLAVLG